VVGHTAVEFLTLNSRLQNIHYVYKRFIDLNILVVEESTFPVVLARDFGNNRTQFAKT